MPGWLYLNPLRIIGERKSQCIREAQYALVYGAIRGPPDAPPLPSFAQHRNQTEAFPTESTMIATERYKTLMATYFAANS